MNKDMQKEKKEEIKPLKLGMYYDDGDSVEGNIGYIEEKINEIIERLNSK